jgi:type II restriction enzyme
VLPDAIATGPGGEVVRLIDVLWLEAGTARVAAAFEVEHATSIYSGIMRLLDLALGQAGRARARICAGTLPGRAGQPRG